MGRKVLGAGASPPGFISGGEGGIKEGVTTYMQSYPHGGANPTSRPFPGNGGAPALVVPDGKPAGRNSAEVFGRNDVTHILATKRTFPDGPTYRASDALVPKGSAVERDFTTNYCAHGKAAPAGYADKLSAGKPMATMSSGGILGFTNTGKPLVDRQPVGNADDYAEGQIILPDGSKPNFVSVHKAGFPARDSQDDIVQQALSARHAGKQVRKGEVLSPSVLTGAHPAVRLLEGQKVKKILAPGGKVKFDDATTNKTCLASDEAARQQCTRTVQKPRNQDAFSLRVEQERKWRKQLLGSNAASKATSAVSTVPAGFQSSVFNERAQRAAKYGSRVVALFEEDVKLGARVKEDIVVPEADGKVCFETTTAAVHYEPPKNYYQTPRKCKPRGLGSESEASAASGFSGAASRVGSEMPVGIDVPRSEASHVSGFSAAMMQPTI